MSELDGIKSDYEFLKSHIPSSLDDKYQQLLSQVENLRYKFIREQRICTLINNRIEEIKANTLNNAELKTILNPTILPRFNLSPAVSQQTSLFIAYIYSEIQIFASSVVAFKKSDQFSYFINVIIPALFCNFTSNEVINDASLFYQHILNIAKPNLAIDILTPLYKSILGYPFIEYVLDNYLPKMANEKRIINKNTTQLLQQQSKTLLLVMMKAIKLLPLCLFTILLMAHNNWPIESLKTLFFDKYFTYLSNIYILSSSYSIFIEDFNEILYFMRNSDEIIVSLMKALLDNSSILVVPDNFKPFNHPYVNILMSPNEVNMIAKCIRAYTNDLPYTVHEMDIKSDYPTTPFFVSYYIKKKKFDLSFDHFIFKNQKPEFPQNNEFLNRYHKIIQNQTLSYKTPYETVLDTKPSDDFAEFSLKQCVAEYIEQANSFENFLYYKIKAKQVDKWSKVSSDMTKVYRKYSVLYFPPRKVELIFQELLPIVEDQETLNNYYVKSMMPIIFKMFNENKPFFNNLTKSWLKMLGSSKTIVDELNLTRFSDTIQCVFWNAVQIFISIDYVPFNDRFFLLLSFMKYLSHLMLYTTKEDIKILLNYIITFSRPETLIHTFVICTSYFIVNTDLTSTINESYISAWTVFHNFMNEYISDDKTRDLHCMVSVLQKMVSRM
ncbi:hypothetical protein TVAG_297660 [Trichomonas vaginalis G3]|uniref:Uncharacterized protein n=1 Tax=Trichomonas vaginalis (strain ATCC PRA-98 / G3) TaxID=412133 RepID=A2DRG1_TRIV3|nr:hypothetical protein TVAGG3_0513600 [Trichomonas vaginalis G3]EAY17087.1 hypothetical protein TVAG_297660 [Trichomonas vaginalis G3]KAI5517959.1 hypothetical protein TVAGG3_0513600 [Trichomonas vaginalis G3]|eukprot:XP_001329310.1 hypothetical protein [Trichomonas vaginalis G3]